MDQYKDLKKNGAIKIHFYDSFKKSKLARIICTRGVARFRHKINFSVALGLMLYDPLNY